ncbi:hypothetical protein ACTPDI_17545 [Clostridioides difficile]|uniref:hypothetical protein n=1 Tax=Clostridioides sp. ZZV15-6598 TaxID=2811501 RepID=UPI001D0FF6C2|nr:hypothetical protein [Clostridioides sp. ZZV15-6598]
METKNIGMMISVEGNICCGNKKLVLSIIKNLPTDKQVLFLTKDNMEESGDNIAINYKFDGEYNEFQLKINNDTLSFYSLENLLKAIINDREDEIICIDATEFQDSIDYEKLKILAEEYSILMFVITRRSEQELLKLIQQKEKTRSIYLSLILYIDEHSYSSKKFLYTRTRNTLKCEQIEFDSDEWMYEITTIIKEIIGW